MTFHSVSKRVNSQQSERALITNALKLTFRRGTCMSRPDPRIHDRHIGKVPLQGSIPM